MKYHRSVPFCEWKKHMKTLLIFSLLAVSVTSLADSLQPKLENHFDADFTIDALHTTDGKTYQMSASGEAGPYGRVYLSYTFTDKQQLRDRGEFTGFAFTQSGEKIVTGTLQGVYVKQGAIYKMYTHDTASNGKFTYAVGTLDFVNKTLSFKAADLVIE
tara:strand:+ start:323 stop:799 length:477 start_codon:yes stop_codon:yes gene_type:complete